MTKIAIVTKMKIRFIINPISGTGNHLPIVKSIIHKHLNKSKFKIEIFETEYPKHATTLAQEAVDKNIEIVAAVGGDGTMHECAIATRNSNTALTVIPCGSGNGFAYHFGMKKNITDSILLLNQSTFSYIDSCTANNIPFFNISGIGFDAHIANLFSNLKVRGFLSYIRLVLKECLSYKAQDYTIEYDNKIETHNAVIISWANTSQFGNDAYISPNSSPTDGLTDICILRDFNRLLVPILIYKLFSKKIHQSKYMKIIRTKSIKISSTNGACHLDGEVLSLKTDIHIETHSKSLKIFFPNG